MELERWECPTCKRLPFTIDIPAPGKPNHTVILECIAIHKSRCDGKNGYVIPPKGDI